MKSDSPTTRTSIFETNGNFNFPGSLTRAQQKLKVAVRTRSFTRDSLETYDGEVKKIICRFLMCLYYYLLAFGLPVIVPLASGGGPGKFQVGASSISPLFWSGAPSTSVHKQ